MQDYDIQELSLANTHANGIDVQYEISHHGFFTVIESVIGVTVFWDGKTRIYIQLDPVHNVSKQKITVYTVYCIAIIAEKAI